MNTTAPVTAEALIATSESGEERATVTVLDVDGAEIAKLDLGEYGYLHDAFEAIRAAGWRVYPDAVQRWAGTTGPGYHQVAVFRD